MKFKIETGVPIPPVAARQGSSARLLQAMKVGESVFFDAPVAKNAVRFYRVAKRMGIKIVVRKVQGGMRMWRVSGDQPTVAMQTRPARHAKKVHATKASKRVDSRRTRGSDAPGQRSAQAHGRHAGT